MLELRPCCEHCRRALPPNATEAMICSFECTFCRQCVESLLKNVCPNCGGGFAPRPIRPQRDWRGGNNLQAYPAATSETHCPVNLDSHQRLLSAVAEIPPERR